MFPGCKGGRCVRLTTLPPSCAVVTESGNLIFLEPCGPLQACNGTDIFFHTSGRQREAFSIIYDTSCMTGVRNSTPGKGTISYFPHNISTDPLKRQNLLFDGYREIFLTDSSDRRIKLITSIYRRNYEYLENTVTSSCVVTASLNDEQTREMELSCRV